MKLIIAMGIEEHTELLRNTFREHHVVVYSELPVQGFTAHAQSPDTGNWFASHADGVYSRVVFAFVPDATARTVIEAIRAWNDGHQPRNPLHAFEVSVDAHA